MELIELKNIWESVNLTIIENDSIDEITMLKTIRKKSHSQISKIRRVLTFKLIIGSFATLVIVSSAVISILSPHKTSIISSIYNDILSDFFTEKEVVANSFITPLEFTLIVSTLAIFMLIMLHYNYLAFKKIKEIQSSALSLNDSLNKVVKIVENIMKLNVNFGAISITLIGAWIAYLFMYYDKDFLFDIHLLYLLKYIIIIFIMAFIIELIGQKMKFSRYVKRLKSYQKTLDQEKD